MDSETIIEPFRIHRVQVIPFTAPQERAHALQRTALNLFGLRAEEVTIDLLTDSGTGAMSSAQWAGMLDGDESYAGSRSFCRFQGAVPDLTGLPEVCTRRRFRTSVEGDRDVRPSSLGRAPVINLRTRPYGGARVAPRRGKPHDEPTRGRACT
jgi:tryptophanase